MSTNGHVTARCGRASNLIQGIRSAYTAITYEPHTWSNKRLRPPFLQKQANHFAAKLNLNDRSVHHIVATAHPSSQLLVAQSVEAIGGLLLKFFSQCFWRRPLFCVRSYCHLTTASAVPSAAGPVIVLCRFRKVLVDFLVAEAWFKIKKGGRPYLLQLPETQKIS